MRLRAPQPVAARGAIVARGSGRLSRLRYRSHPRIGPSRSPARAGGLGWAASESVPPAPGFADRIRALGTACEQQARSLAEAGWIKGFAWTPIPGARDMTISGELRPSANRPGPSALWEQFDRAVNRLGVAMEGQIMYVVAFRYRDLAAVMHEIADVLLGESPDTREQRQ